MNLNPPILYDDANLFSASYTPSMVHVKNTALQRFFRRYLYFRAISVFKWKVPKAWNMDYFLFNLYNYGFISVIETDKYGVIPQHGALYGYDVFYQPTNIIITNPLLKGNLKPRIGVDCVLFKLNSDYRGIADLIGYYADLMALASESVNVNMLNTHLAMVFGAENKPQAETYKKLFDQVSGGYPAVVTDKKVLGENGTPSWFPFVQNIGENYISDKILSDLRKIECMFDSKIGIPNANTDKRERLITDEVNSNNIETVTMCEMWLDRLKESCKDCKDMFGVSVSVNWRNKPNKGGAENGNSFDSRNV